MNGPADSHQGMPKAVNHAVATRDHHIDPGDHFATEPDYVDSWPRPTPDSRASARAPG